MKKRLKKDLEEARSEPDDSKNKCMRFRVDPVLTVHNKNALYMENHCLKTE
jgi:hypothetical protein